MLLKRMKILKLQLSLLHIKKKSFHYKNNQLAFQQKFL